MGWQQSGLANVELGVGFDPATRVNLGSVAKVITGALADRVWPSRPERESTLLRSVLPAFTGHWLGEVSVEQLLTHAAGLFDYRGVLELSGRARRGFVSRAQIMQLAIQQTSPACVPLQYSSTGYVLVRTALEAVTRTPVADLVTQWSRGHAVGFLRTDFEGLIPGRAEGYRHSEGSELRRWNFAADDAGASNYWGTLAEAVRAMELVASDARADAKIYGAIESRGHGGTWLAIGDDGGFTSAILVRHGMVSAGAVSNDPGTPAINLIQGSLHSVEFANPPHLAADSPQNTGRPHMGLQPGAYVNNDFGVEIQVEAEGEKFFIRSGGRRYPLEAGRSAAAGWLVRESDGVRLVADFGHVRAIEFSRC